MKLPLPTTTRNRLHTLHKRARDTWRELRALATPVQAILAAEALAALTAAGAAGLWAHATVVGFDPSAGTPPWRALPAVVALGAAAHLARQQRPIGAARRWHGVLIRRLDARWSTT